MNKPVFIYKGFEITFQTDDGSVMVNATEMAKPFNKRPIDWLNLTSSQNYIQALREVRYPNITPAESAGLIETVRGNYSDGSQQGTWMHEDVALEFARWLSPEFAIWCNDRGESYNLPTQRAMELKLFEIKKTSITQPDGTVFVTSTTKVTPKGQMYFVNSFLYGRS